MIPVPSGVQVWLATGHTDMRKGFDGLAVLVQETLKRNPHNGNLFVFRGRRGGLLPLLALVACQDRRKVQLLRDQGDDETRKMPRRHKIMHRWRQQKSLIQAPIAEGLAHASLESDSPSSRQQNQLFLRQAPRCGHF